MKAVAILCGGKGTRLGYDGQKCMVPVAGRPFLAYKLDLLCARGATEFHLLVSHRQVEVYTGIGKVWNGRPVHYHSDSGYSAERAVQAASRHMPFIHWLTYGDSIFDVPLKHSMFPYVYSNPEFEDAGLLYCWGASMRGLRKFSDTWAVHCNTPADLARAETYLRRRGLARTGS